MSLPATTNPNTSRGKAKNVCKKSIEYADGTKKDGNDILNKYQVKCPSSMENRKSFGNAVLLKKSSEHLSLTQTGSSPSRNILSTSTSGLLKTPYSSNSTDSVQPPVSVSNLSSSSSIIVPLGHEQLFPKLNSPTKTQALAVSIDTYVELAEKRREQVDKTSKSFNGVPRPKTATIPKSSASSLRRQGPRSSKESKGKDGITGVGVRGENRTSGQKPILKSRSQRPCSPDLYDAHKVPDTNIGDNNDLRCRKEVNMSRNLEVEDGVEKISASKRENTKSVFLDRKGNLNSDRGNGHSDEFKNLMERGKQPCKVRPVQTSKVTSLLEEDYSVQEEGQSGEDFKLTDRSSIAQIAIQRSLRNYIKKLKLVLAHQEDHENSNDLASLSLADAILPDLRSALRLDELREFQHILDVIDKSDKAENSVP